MKNFIIEHAPKINAANIRLVLVTFIICQIIYVLDLGALDLITIKGVFITLIGSTIGMIIVFSLEFLFSVVKSIINKSKV